MSLKLKLPLLFTLLVFCILIANTSLYYTRSKEVLIEANEQDIAFITEEVAFLVENAKESSLYVEDLLAAELRTAAIAAQQSLPPDYRDVTNEQLQQLAQELRVSHITLLAQTENDIVGVRSSDPAEINMSTKDWLFWYDAFEQLFALEPVTVKEGLALPNYWSGPVEIAASNPDHTDKWGYYHDGSTNYIINPYYRDNHVLEFEKRYGPGSVISIFKEQFEGMLELTVFNPEKFSDDDLTFQESNGNRFVRIADEPIWYGAYQYKNINKDRDIIQKALETGRVQTYRQEIAGIDAMKTFVPIIRSGDEPYVIGITYDYGVIESKLRSELIKYALWSVLFFGVVILASILFSRSITKPMATITNHVNDIAGGNFGVQLPIKRKDELGTLTQHINAMSAFLMKYVTDLTKTSELVKYQAYHDPLTGLYNRRAFEEEVEKLSEKNEEGLSAAVMFVDMDRFKEVNDSFGHKKGDEIIIEASQRLKEAIQNENALLVRQGGDEFVLLFSNMSKEKIKEEVQKVAAAFQKPFVLNEQDIFMTVSCGISFYPMDTKDPDMLIIYADEAMYDAKKQGRSRIVYFNERINKENSEKRKIESRLRKAIKEEKIQVHYQAKVDGKTGQITGAEALARWTDEELGFVPPDKFVEIAEDSGLIGPLWEVVMRKACRSMADWNKQLPEPLSIAVNVSAKQFFEPKELVAKTQQLLQESGLSPEMFELEMTESVLLNKSEETVKALQEFRSLGIRVSVDDFGTGYSSLSYLQSLPIHCLKIDRSFVQSIQEDESGSEIARAVIQLADSLKLEVVAEGVEEKHQKEFLLENGCRSMQGYLFSRPLPKTEFTKLISS